MTSKKLSEVKPKAQAELSVYLVRRTWRGIFEPSKANIPLQAEVEHTLAW